MKKNSEIKASYLTEYADTIEALPLELQRNYTLIRQLDEHAEDLMSQVAKEVGLLSTSNLPIEERKEKLALIGQLLNESLKKGEEKFALAKSTYDTVDRHCTRLDNDLQKIEDEQLIGSGRSSNVNTLAANQSNKRSRDLSDHDGAAQTQAQKKQADRKRTKEVHAENSTTTQDDEYLSTHDAMQHAKAAATLSDLPIDPNEPLYCYCSQVSFGEMVACDNPECEIEWFHLECVGLKTPPKGKWYCKNCTAELKKRKKL